MPRLDSTGLPGDPISETQTFLWIAMDGIRREGANARGALGCSCGREL